MEDKDLRTAEDETPSPDGVVAEEASGGEVAEAGVSEDPEPAAPEPEAADTEAASVDQPASDAPAAEAIAEQLGMDLQEERTTDASDELRFRALLEAIIYMADEPMSAAQIAAALDRPEDLVKSMIAKVIADCESAGRGLMVREVAGGFKMGTKPEFHDELRTFVKRLKPPLKLSLAALETLAVIAYKQPITAPEIMEIRGVQGAGVLKTLLERKLITAAGRKQVVGRPVLYKTTKEFLIQFGLRDLAELPTLKEFEEWSRLAVGEPEAETAVESRNEPIPATGPGTPPVPPVEEKAEAPSEAAPEAASPTPEPPSEPHDEAKPKSDA